MNKQEYKDYIKKKKEKELVNYRDKIEKYNDKVWFPPFKPDYKNKTTSCFDFKIASYDESSDDLQFQDNKTIINKKELIKCKEIDMKVNPTQHNIFQLWFIAFILMYNETINYIKKRISMADIKRYKQTNIKIRELKNSLKEYNKEYKDLIKDKNKIVKKIHNQKKKLRTIDGNAGNAVNEEEKLDILQCDYRDIVDGIKQYKGMIHELNDEIHINQKLEHKIYDIINFINLRANLKDIRNKIIQNSQYNKIKYNTKINVHNIDYAIKSAVTSYKSCITNYLNGNIKNFRVKFMRKDKKRKVMDIENQYITNNQICPKILGDIKYFYNKESYTLNKGKNVKLYYDSDLNIYKLFVPESIEFDQINSTKYIGIDLGIRTFITAITNNEVIEIGSNMREQIESYLNKIDNIDKYEKDETIKVKKKRKYMRKIKFKVNELHWKAIKFLTDNHGTIAIGNLKSKDCINNETSVLRAMCKRVLSLLSPYKFIQRLQYKCAIRGINLIIVDEMYTTRVCNKCGWKHDNLGSSKVFKCPNPDCGLKIGRDDHSARGMVLKALL